MDKQSNITQFINSNLLTDFMTEGGLVQTNQNEYRLFLRPKHQIVESTGYNKNELSSHFLETVTVYKPPFWAYLDRAQDKIEVDYSENYLSILVYQNEFLKILTHIQKMGLAQSESQVQNLQFIKLYENEFKTQFDWSMQQFQHSYSEKDCLKKTVPICKKSFRLKSPFAFVKAMNVVLSRQHNNVDSSPTFLYGFWNQTNGFLGETPEKLFSYSAQSYQTVAIAGTWKKEIQIDFAENVDQKTKQEHQHVIDDIQSRFTDEKYFKSKVLDTKIIPLQFLNHLKTEIQLEPTQLADSQTRSKFLIQQLHPTAALGVYPRNNKLTREFAQLPLQSERNLFGSPIGFLTPNYGLVVVGIRQIQWSHEKLTLDIYAGCGVTADSQYVNEFEEIELKLNSIQKGFGL